MLFWKAAGQPAIKSAIHNCNGSYCACCGVEINEGVLVEDVAGTAISRQNEMFAGEYVCQSCAWMCEDATQKNRNVLVLGNEIYWAMIGIESATSERPSWLDLLHKASLMPVDVAIQGVLTTDPKPRLWNMSKPCTIGNFGLYVHCTDYDISDFVYFDLQECLHISNYIIELLKLGYSKRACFFGLLSDLKKVKKDPLGIIQYESKLKELRQSKAFIPALLISGIAK